MENNISGRKLLKILFIKVFTADILNAIINIVLPVCLSIHCVFYTKEIKWKVITIVVIAIIILFNIVSVIARKISLRNEKELKLVYKCYNEMRVINNDTANRIFSLNNLIKDCISDNKPINIKTFDMTADFQTISFGVCKSIHNMLNQEFGEDINCEVTVMKKNGDIIKMVAYANNDNAMPSSYKSDFNLGDPNHKEIYFAKIFSDLNATIYCLPNKKSVTDNFKKLPGSDVREDQICQYIGIPIKTNRNEIELLLQIDISKENIFGKTETDVLLFAKNILEPYTALLHKTYERDLIFNQYYDTIIEKLSG